MRRGSLVTRVDMTNISIFENKIAVRGTNLSTLTIVLYCQSWEARLCACALRASPPTMHYSGACAERVLE